MTLISLRLPDRVIEDLNEDPFPSIPYFYQLMLAADYPSELIELGCYFDDYHILFPDDPGERDARVLVRPWRTCFPQSCFRKDRSKEKPPGSCNKLESNANGLTS
jgi:hypothetical protein